MKIVDKLTENKNGRYRKPSPQVHSNPIGQPNTPIPPRTFVYPGGTLTIILTGTQPLYNSIKDTGIRAGEIIGKRCWWVINNEYLFSVYMTHVEWHPNIPMEGDVDIGLGVHAFKNDEDLIAYGFESQTYSIPSRPWSDSRYIVSGTVAMWGKIMEHERGYRAQYAKILSLDESVDKALKMKYGV